MTKGQFQTCNPRMSPYIECMKKNPISQTEPETNEAEPTFRLVGECLYRHASSETYYALIKRGGKQFRRSLKTKDRKLAERKLAELREQIGAVSIVDEDRNSDFEKVAC